MNEIQRLGVGYGFAFNSKKLKMISANIGEEVFNEWGSLLFKRIELYMLVVF